MRGDRWDDETQRHFERAIQRAQQLYNPAAFAKPSIRRRIIAAVRRLGAAIAAIARKVRP